MDARRALHPPLHPQPLAGTGPTLAIARVLALAIVDFEIAVHHRHAGPVALLVVLAVLANIGAVAWLSERLHRPAWRAVALALMGAAGGLLAALQHGSPALALPGLAVAQAVADVSAPAVLAVSALSLLGLELGVLWAGLGASAALGYPAILLACALVWLTRRQYVERGRAADALVAQTRATEAESRRAAALDERTRIAREIHDVLAHALGGLSVQLEAAEMLLSQRSDLDGALERIRASQRTAREGLEEARRAVAALRDDAPPLPDSLAELVRGHREQGASAELAIEGSARSLAPEAALALMRAAQEALTNARRHAPGSAVSVRLVYGADSASVIVTSSPAMREPAPLAARGVGGGYGLAGMRERLELAGGRLRAGPGPEGWTVRAEVPG